MARFDRFRPIRPAALALTALLVIAGAGHAAQGPDRGTSDDDVAEASASASAAFASESAAATGIASASALPQSTTQKPSDKPED